MSSDSAPQNSSHRTPSLEETNYFHFESVEDFRRLLRDNEERLLIVDLSASWCGPCKRIESVFEDLAAHYRTEGETNLAFAHTTEGDDSDLASELEDEHGFSITAFPSFVVFRRGKFHSGEFWTGGNPSVLKENVGNYLARILEN